MSAHMQLSFIRPKPFSVFDVSWFTWLVFALFLLLGLLTLQHYFSVKQRLSSAESQLAKARMMVPSQAASEATEKVFELPKREVGLIKLAVHQLSIPWQPLFQTIEQTKHKSIALLELSPSDQKDLLILRGEAKTLDAVFVYIRSLETSDSLDKVYLQSHSVDNADRSKPVLFTIYASWKDQS